MEVFLRLDCCDAKAFFGRPAKTLAIAVVTLSHRKMQEREGRWLKWISGSIMLALGLTMVFRPDWLS